MKVTNFNTDGLPQPLGAWSTGVVSTASNALFSAASSNTLAVNGVTVTGAAASNYHILASSPTAAAWVPDAGGGGTVSAGSNSTRVRGVSTAGASTTLWSPFDHAHDGIGTVTASASNTMARGTLNLRSGTGISLSLTDSDGDGEFDTATIVNTVAAGGGGGGGGPTDYVSGAAATGQIIIPGLAGSSDIRVAATNDDEFDTTDTSDPMTGWTTLGTPTVHDINSTVKSHYYVKKSATTLNIIGIYKAIPSTPFTVSCKLTGNNRCEGNARASLMLGETTPGKMLTMGMDGFLNTVAPALIVDTWTSPTSYAGTSVTRSTAWPGLQYLRFVVASTTSVAGWVSYNGVVWSAWFAALNPGFTVGSVGLVGGAPASGVDSEAFFDWIRFT